jgi:hypothetical protein
MWLARRTLTKENPMPVGTNVKPDPKGKGGRPSDSPKPMLPDQMHERRQRHEAEKRKDPLAENDPENQREE